VSADWQITEFLARLPAGSVAYTDSETASVLASAVEEQGRDVEVRYHPWAPVGAIYAVTPDGHEVALIGMTPAL
jgi:hypothetical protein